MQTYYQDNYITIYHGDCREILPGLVGVRSIVADPPYGISLDTGYNESPRIYPNGKKQIPLSQYGKGGIEGDNNPFSPAHLLGYENVILWGAENYADKLPVNRKWLIWDKRTDVIPSRTQGDGEMAWTNQEGTNRIFRHIWDGMVKDSERGIPRQHPTQKPIALMIWCIQQIKDPGLICDPYAGSGSTLVAAKQLGLQAIGIEIVEQYCEVAAKRVSEASVMLPDLRQPNKGLQPNCYQSDFQAFLASDDTL